MSVLLITSAQQSVKNNNNSIRKVFGAAVPTPGKLSVAVEQTEQSYESFIPGTCRTPLPKNPETENGKLLNKFTAPR